MFPILHLGPLAIQAPGFILLVGLWLGMSLAEKHSLQFGVKKDYVSSIVLAAAGGALLLARLAYAAEHLDAYLARPLSLLSLDTAALAPWGGALGALLGAFIYGQRKAIPWAAMLDALSPLLAVMGVALPLANLASGNGYGAPTSLPWGIELWGTMRHPSQVYEIIAAAFILMDTWPSYGIEPPRPAGRTFWRFAAWTAGARLFLEAFRGDSTLLPGGVRAEQIGAWLVLAVSLWVLGKLREAEAAERETFAASSEKEQL